MSLSLTGHKRMFCFTVCVLRRKNLLCSMYRSAEFRLECAAFHRQLCRLNICETFSGKTKKNQTNTAVRDVSQSYVHLKLKYTGPS